MIAVLILIVSHLPMKGDAVDSLYTVFLNSQGGSQAQTADAIYREMHNNQFLDTLMRFDPKEKTAVRETRLHYWVAEYFFDKEEFDSSLQAIQRATELLGTVKDLSIKSDVLGSLANIHFRLGNYDEALKAVLEAFKIDKHQGNDELISSDLNTIAAIYLAVHQPEPGIMYIEKAIALERKLNRQDRLAIRLGMAAELYLMIGDYDKAMTCVKEAYDIDKQGGREEKAAIRLSQMGLVLEKIGDINNARNKVLTALKTLEKYDNTYSIAVCHNQLGGIEHKLGNDSDAIQHYKKALEESIDCGSPKVERIAERGLWECMRETNPAVAMLHLERYTAMTDSLHNRIISTQMKVLNTTKDSMELSKFNQNNARANRLFLWGGTLLGLMLLLAAVALFYSWRRSKSALKIQQQTQDLRSRFLSNITRELHTPLSVILSAGQQLRNGGKTSTEENHHIGEMIINYGNNMLEMVNQLIDTEMVRESVEKPEWKHGDVVMFTRMLVENHVSEAHQQGIRLEFFSPHKSLYVVFPSFYLRKIVHGLVINSLKYTSRNGSITVTLSPHDDNRLKLTVTDTGKGIPTDELGRLFEPFVQGSNGDDGVGTVLDLSLVHQLVKALDGEIDVSSKLGEGTEFIILLPVRKAPGSITNNQEEATHFAERRIRQGNSSKHKPLVFIVENNDDVAFFIANQLQDNYQLRFARDGNEAYQNAQDMMPDLIVTNIMMPVMDGKELIRLVRGNTALSHIPIIAMTSSTSEQERMSCIEAGADFVLVKPFNSSEMKLVVCHLLDRHSALHESFSRTSDQQANKPAAAPMAKEDKEFINKLVNIIHAQMAKEDIDMEHIAAALSLSRKQLRTRVMDITGQTPVAFALQVRLNYARRMITSEDTPLTIIARRCGFQTASHFSKSFKQQFGVSPQQYRKNADDINGAITKT